MSSQILCVVGDKFAKFAGEGNGVTFGQFENVDLRRQLGINRIVVGQGISAEQIKAIKTHVETCGAADKLIVQESVSRKVDRVLVHKRVEKNVMVTHPERVSENDFTADMVVDDDCAEMSDHTTGIHMQGTLFVEAARQMFMACSMYLLEPYGGYHKYIFTLQNIEVDYRKFFYPLPISMELSLEKVKEFRKMGVLQAVVNITFSQLGEKGVTCQCKARGYQTEVLQNFEEDGASDAFERMYQLAGITDSTSNDRAVLVGVA